MVGVRTNLTELEKQLDEQNKKEEIIDVSSSPPTFDAGVDKFVDYLSLYTHEIKKPNREIIGREAEMMKLNAGLSRPEYCNVILLAEAGTGKTALVQGLMLKDDKRKYYEVDLSKMIADLPDPNEMAARLKALFDQVEYLHNKEGKEIVLFMDEFHQVVQLSDASVEALKPLLADSGTRGIKVIAATTLKEFDQFIAPNQPLVERLQRINVPEPGKDMTISILKGFAKSYGVASKFHNDSIYELIYEYTNRYVPANAQPRKSILMLDSMVGWHRASGKPLDKKLLAEVIYQNQGINVAFRVDAVNIKKELDSAVYAQELASTIIANRLQIAVADLNNKSKPMASFLFSGSTGVGKTEMTKQLASILFGRSRDDGDENQSSNKNLIRFDMTEYANPDSLERFREEITAKIWERPYSVVLLDEIEKACAEVTRVLLQVLDDGRLTDRHGRQVIFTNCYIILTTNAGAEVYETISQYNASDTGNGDVMKHYMKLIRRSITQTTGDNRFPPELLGRIDEIVPFQPLSEETMKRIVTNKLSKLAAEIRDKHGIEVLYQKKLVNYIVLDNLDTSSVSGGARIVLTKLEQEVTMKMAAFINANPNIRSITVLVEGRTAWDNKELLNSEAYVRVVPTGGV